MKKGPKKYSKEELVDFLRKNNVNSEIIKRVENLPESVNINGENFDLNVLISWYDDQDTYYEFELNYYSIESIEFLLPYSIEKNIEVSLNVIECELFKRNLIEYETVCNS